MVWLVSVHPKQYMWQWYCAVILNRPHIQVRQHLFFPMTDDCILCVSQAVHRYWGVQFTLINGNVYNLQSRNIYCTDASSCECKIKYTHSSHANHYLHMTVYTYVPVCALLCREWPGTLHIRYVSKKMMLTFGTFFQNTFAAQLCPKYRRLLLKVRRCLPRSGRLLPKKAGLYAHNFWIRCSFTYRSSRAAFVVAMQNSNGKVSAKIRHFYWCMPYVTEAVWVINKLPLRSS